MKLAVAALVLTLGSSAARADDADGVPPLYACHPLAASQKLRAQLGPEVTLQQLTTWMVGFSCKSVVFTPDVARHATKIDVIAPRDMTPKEAMQLYVDAVEATGLVVVQKGDTVTIKLGPGMATGCPDVASSAPPPPTPLVPWAPDPLAADLDAGVHVGADGAVTLSATVVADLVANPMAVASGARLVPNVKNGAPAGFKLYALRPASLLARIGFMNGDTVLAINGFDLGSPDKATEVYAQLRDATSIQIDLERRGKPMGIKIHVASPAHR